MYIYDFKYHLNFYELLNIRTFIDIHQKINQSKSLKSDSTISSSKSNCLESKIN